MALLSALHSDPPISIPAENRQQLLADAAEALIIGYSKLDPISQAWILTAIPGVDALQSIISMAQKSENKHIRIAYLLYHVNNENDPMIEAAQRSEDEDVKFVANLLKNIMLKRKENIQ